MFYCSKCRVTLYELPLREMREDLCDRCFGLWVTRMTTGWQQDDLLEECGSCGHRHPIGFTGDCRDDRNRF